MVKDLVEEAYGVALASEQKSQELYLKALEMIPEGRGKLVLHKLAREEAGIVNCIVESCPDCVRNMVGQPVENRPFPLGNLPEAAPELQLFQILGVVLADKSACVARYRAMIEAFREPGVAGVFNLVLARSGELLQRISAEYRQSELRLQRPVLNRRTKRTHIRWGFGRTLLPNKHTQLFISLQEAGRRPLL